MSSSDWSDELLLADTVAKCNHINSLALINGQQLSQLMVACYHGNLEYVNNLMESPELDINLTNKEGKTCSHVCM